MRNGGLGRKRTADPAGNSTEYRPKIAYITTVPATLETLMRGHLRYMRDAGFEVLAISSHGEELSSVADREGVATVAVEIAREIRLWTDLKTLARLIGLFREHRPEIVNAGTPKAGLLGMLAARAAGVPVRIYTLRGLRLETKSGFGALVLYITECLACLSATSIVSVSRSLQAELRARRILGSRKSLLVGEGSSNGVQWSRFAEVKQDGVAGPSLPGIATPDPARPILGFVGRIVKDKGVEDLVRAFQLIQDVVPDALLVLVGAFESGDAILPQTRQAIEANNAIVVTGFVDDTSRYYPLFDVLLFPSYREGFPNVPLEAACAQVPAVGFDVTGTKDAIVDGMTGYLVPKGSADQLAARAVTYLEDPQLRAEHGLAASDRARSLFGQERIWGGLADLYRRLLQRKGR